MSRSRSATAAEASLLVVDGRGELVAAAGEGRALWGACAASLRGIAQRAIADGATVEAIVDGGEWQATAQPGASGEGNQVALLRVSRISSDVWSKAGALDGEKYQALCRLVSGMVHELRNPLAGISLGAELLQARPDLPPEVRAKLGDMVGQVDRAAEVLQSLRRFSREEQPTMRHQSLNALAQDAARLERAVLAVRGIELVLDLDPDLPPVLADPSQLRLVIANLVRNAGEAMAEDRPEAKRKGRIVLRTSHRHGVVRLTVEDDGPGITPALLTRVFDPYFTTKKSGTGLGLAMSYGIVKAHGGHLWAENRRTQGARFLFDLPDPQHSTPVVQPNTLGIDLGEAETRSVLLVSDEERLDRLRQSVAGCGLKVHVAASANVALRKLRAADFDAVLVAGYDAEAASDLVGRARLAQPQALARTAVLLERDPGAELSARLRLTGARVVTGSLAPADVQALVRDLATLARG